MKCPKIATILRRLKSIKRDLFTYGPHGDTPNRPCGAAHFYFKLNKDWGIKFRKPATQWVTMEEVVQNLMGCYERQKHAASLGLAPPVGEIIECEVNGVEYIGYVTAHVFTIHYNNYGDMFTDAERVLVDLHNSDEARLRTAVGDAFGCYMSDCKVQNCGLYQGALVCLDVGIEGFDHYNRGCKREYFSERYSPEDIKRLAADDKKYLSAPA